MESIKLSYQRYLRYFLAKDDTTATQYDKYMALSYAVRSEMVDRWIATQRRYHDPALQEDLFFVNGIHLRTQPETEHTQS